MDLLHTIALTSHDPRDFNLPQPRSTPTSLPDWLHRLSPRPPPSAPPPLSFFRPFYLSAPAPAVQKMLRGKHPRLGLIIHRRVLLPLALIFTLVNLIIAFRTLVDALRNLGSDETVMAHRHSRAGRGRPRRAWLHEDI
jgi:hypothetical protein